MSVLVTRGLTHAYRRLGRRRSSLAAVDLTVAPGQCLGLVGPNGSGKSTLLRLCAGVMAPLAGDVEVLGHPAGSRAARRATGWVPEQIRWPRALTVNDALCELAALGSARGIVTRVDQVCGLLGLGPLLGRRLGSLSRGQARRVVIAQALLDDPALLLFDEAFSGLDSLVLRDLRDDLALRLAGGAALVLATHRVEDLAGLATEVLALHDGRVVVRGPADEVLAEAQRREGLAALLDSGAPP